MKSMFRATVLMTALVCCTLSAAAEETLFSGDVDHGGYGGPEIRVTSVSGDAAPKSAAERRSTTNPAANGLSVTTIMTTGAVMMSCM